MATARLRSAVVLFVALTATGFAQEPETSELHGTVTDQTGGVVGGAAITLEGGTSRTWTVATDRQGRYTFERIPPGTYAVTVRTPGFLDFTARVELRPDASNTLAIVVKLGLSVSLEVKETAGLSNDPRKNLSALILTGKDIEALPDNPRLFLLKILEMAGSTGRPGDVAIYVDGFREYKRLPPKRTIEMIRVNSNPFSAEFSQPSTRRIEIVTKPGADSFHGGGTLQARSSRLDARNPLAETKPTTQYRNYSGYLQGPVRKEQVGFMLYAGQWQQDDNALVHATVLDPTTLVAQAFAATVLTPSSVTSAMLKFDFRLFNQMTSVSYARTSESHRNQGLDGGFDLPEHAYDRSSHDDVGRLWLTSVGRRSLNDIRVEFSRSVTGMNAHAQTPAVLVLDAFNAGGNQSAASRTTTAGLQASETLTIQQGAHTFKTGVQIETSRQDSVDRTGFGGTFTFGADIERDESGAPVLNSAGQPIPLSPIENYRRTLLGLRGYGPSQFSIATGDPDVGVAQWHLGWFALDDWFISKRVSLSYGVRQELQGNVARRVNLAPRASLSWLVDDKGKSAIKLGTGVFYGRVDSGITLDTRKLDGTRRQQFIYQYPTFLAAAPSALVPATPTASAVYTKAEDLRTPYSLVTTLGYERELPHGLFAVGHYLFSKGARQLRLRNISVPQAGSLGLDTAPPILQFESTGRSTQHELMLGLRGNAGSALTLYGNYQLGRKYSDTDGPYTTPANSADLSTEYGASIDDRRHQLVAGATVQMAGGIAIDPSVTVKSGQPFNITTGRDNNADTIFTDRPAFAEPGDAGAVQTAFGLFNENPRPGDVIIPRNLGREPWQASVNLAVSKSLLNGLSVTVDAENLLNTSRFAGSNGVLTSPVFGMPNRALNARRVEITIRYGF